MKTVYSRDLNTVLTQRVDNDCLRVLLGNQYVSLMALERVLGKSSRQWFIDNRDYLATLSYIAEKPLKELILFTINPGTGLEVWIHPRMAMRFCYNNDKALNYAYNSRGIRLGLISDVLRDLTNRAEEESSQVTFTFTR